MSDVYQKPDLPALHRLAYSQDGLFTTRQAQERGVSAQLLAHHARSGRFQRMRQGLYRLSDYPAGEHDEIRAAWLTVGMERAIVSHESALVLHGLSDVLSPTAIQSGRTVREPANTGVFGRLRSHLRSSYRFHTGLRAHRNPTYAMLNARIAFFPRVELAFGASHNLVADAATGALVASVPPIISRHSHDSANTARGDESISSWRRRSRGPWWLRSLCRRDRVRSNDKGPRRAAHQSPAGRFLAERLPPRPLAHQ